MPSASTGTGPSSCELIRASASTSCSPTRRRSPRSTRPTSFDEAARRAQADTKLAALTRSEKGSVILGGGKSIAIPAAPVAKVVDTTGAGDLYAAGFLFGIASGRDLETAGRLGSLAAAEIISHIGARPEISLRELARERGLAVNRESRTHPMTDFAGDLTERCCCALRPGSW